MFYPMGFCDNIKDEVYQIKHQVKPNYKLTTDNEKLNLKISDIHDARNWDELMRDLGQRKKLTNYI